MRNVFFGLATKYDDGIETSVAINGAGVVLEVHRSQAWSELWHHVGAVSGETIQWGGSVHYDDGINPSVALNDRNVAVEVHESQGNSGLWYHVGTVSNGSVSWGGAKHYDDGADPSVAVNNDGVVLEVHKSQSNNGLWCHVGKVNGTSINWGGSVKFASGQAPQVALNNHGVAVCVYPDGSELWCRVGYIQNGNSIRWGGSVKYDNGIQPTVAVTDDGLVIEVHRSDKSVGLWRRMGRISGDSIIWEAGPTQYDDGANPSVACAGNMAIQTHKSEDLSTLWASNSLLMDRARWMTDRLSALGSKTLKNLVLPASHDSGMYQGGLQTVGKAQDLSIYEQLDYGIRYFDLRPKWNGSAFNICHGIVTGPALTDILNQVVQFMQAGSKELVVLKFSHFENFGGGSAVYKKLTAQITGALGRWLVTKQQLADKRLAEATLSQLVQNGGRVVVVCDGDMPVDYPADGIWVYRDWDAEKPAQGDLRVYDVYSNTISYDTMKSNQFAKFNAYTGICKNKQDGKEVPCDMFLLSWTLTPPTDVWNFSTQANRNLADALRELRVPNAHGQIVNVLYVDYVEYARVTDVTVFQNGLQG
ncbi:MAG: hypothetical protein K2X44_09415 [Magnetospirillum sp.]|nr:hypothetical protein [Magnetospirillum sp.]